MRGAKCGLQGMRQVRGCTTFSPESFLEHGVPRVELVDGMERVQRLMRHGHPSEAAGLLRRAGRLCRSYLQDRSAPPPLAHLPPLFFEECAVLGNAMIVAPGRAGPRGRSALAPAAMVP